MYIRVKVIPSAKNESIKAVSETSFNISVKERAERNMANDRVKRILAIHLDKTLADIKLVSGHHSRIKLFSIKE